jgi:hypothetical protein|tara:strand:+ start:140 stop:337 length:198 start_codon:yes stop_codon:yes gene_type:complete
VIVQKEKIMELNDQIISGLKAKLLYEKCNCTPIDRCECDRVMEDIRVANEWIESLPGETNDCSDG